tara:strand:+ start:359 stop:1069 length:711 start_codon:yes stop_codon:yes gene_type:complete
MATSGTTTFDLSIDEIVEEAYERCGIQTNSGYDLKKARRSLNILFSEWGNRGVHLWKVQLNAVALVGSQSQYDTVSGCNDVLEAFISNSATTVNPGSATTDVSITKIDRSTYASLPNKGSTGTPSQYYVQRITPGITVPTITLYITPDASSYTHLKYYSIQRVEDAGAYTNNADVPFRWIPCMVSGLAFYLSQKYAPERTQQLKLYYEDEVKRALDEDGSRSSTFITPANYYPGLT